ncbi:MAG: o-succinylbenzoate synthase [Cytophagales bacterium]|nr:o-succinylbenzoate synthase [Cytophagales bacterium]
MKIDILKYQLDFRFAAGTSRGTMASKQGWFLVLRHSDNPNIYGIGECGPLYGLSPDLNHNVEGAISKCKDAVESLRSLNVDDIHEMISGDFPALRFALETAVRDLDNDGKRIIYQNDFSDSKTAIPINGLVWMGKRALMLERIKQKIKEGFECIKIKVGAINFEDELELLKYIRSRYSSEEITIRLDANGAFRPENALTILDRLQTFDIHSIEQPLEAGNWRAMERICNQSPIPVALDEELIGIDDPEVKRQLLERIGPSYIILKPTLVGGLKKCEEWIKVAERQNTGWWMTSALESNIGLNAIAQFTANYPIQTPQGLGTGQLYVNNIASPLKIENGGLKYAETGKWDLSKLII